MYGIILLKLLCTLERKCEIKLEIPVLVELGNECFQRLMKVSIETNLINPRRACAGGYCSCPVSVCVSVCLLSHISPLELLFVLKILSRTQRATEVKKFVGFSLKPLHCGDPAHLG